MIAERYRDEMRRLGKTLRRRWSELGLAVQEEPFRCHPRAFLGCVPITVGLDPGDRRRGSG